MKIEHITLGGNSVIRDTTDILDTTRKVFDIISWRYESQVLHLPKLPFQVKITATPVGAAFDIMKDNNPVVTNLCCFEKKSTAEVLQSVQSLSDMFARIGVKLDVIEPVTPQWLYSTVINPLGLSALDMIIAGEVELYIFEQLYRAYENE